MLGPNKRPGYGWSKVMSRVKHGDLIDVVPDIDDDEMVHYVGLDPRDGRMCDCVPTLVEYKDEPDRLYHRGMMHRLADEVTLHDCWPDERSGE